MINTPGHQRFSLIATVIFLYFLPVLILSAFGVKFFPNHVRWVFFSAGCLFASIGSIFILLRMISWEGKVWSQIDSLAHEKVNILLKNEKDSKEDELDISSPIQLQLAFDNLKKTQESYSHLQKSAKELEMASEAKENELKKELETLKISTDLHFKEKNQLIQDYSETLNEMRKEIESKNNLIKELETAVNDLNYEVQTLVQVSTFEKDEAFSKEMRKEPLFESPPPLSVIPHPPYPQQEMPPFAIKPSTPTLNTSSKGAEDASLELRRCLNIAQKMTGPSYFGHNSRFADMGMQSLALEERRLFDSLAIESRGVILVYSQKDDRLLFVSDAVKELTGWTSDKFSHDFFQMIQSSALDFRKALQTLTVQGEAKVSLGLKTKQGSVIQTKCLMGSIPTGIFKNYVIAILF